MVRILRFHFPPGADISLCAVDVIPICAHPFDDILADIYTPTVKHVPAWFPGAQFKRQAAEYKRLVDDMFYAPYKQFKAAWVCLICMSLKSPRPD